MSGNYYDNVGQGHGSGATAAAVTNYDDYDEEEEDPTVATGGKRANILPIHGNAGTLNINPLILTNIQGSPYFKVSLFGMKTYHEVVDEIYYKVAHLEPWERGSRKTSGQTGMCGGVRGVGAGGIVSSAYCLLFKLGTLKLTRKQLVGLLNHADSPYIRGLGFMYIRYAMNPLDFWEWFEPYLEDEEVIDVKAGGGKEMTIGELVRSFMERLEWFDTRFPRIPVHVQKQMGENIGHYFSYQKSASNSVQPQRYDETGSSSSSFYNGGTGAKAVDHRDRRRSRSKSRDRSLRHRSRSRDRGDERKKHRSRSRDRRKHRRRSRSRSRSKKSKHGRRSRSRDKAYKSSRTERERKYSSDEQSKYANDRHGRKEKKKRKRRSRSRSSS